MNPHAENYPIWHPFSQMKTVHDLPIIAKAYGPWLETHDGRRIFDAISSWWVNLHGHSHPYIAQKVHEQMLKLEHVIFAGFTHEPAIELCNRLSKYLPKSLTKYFFSDNGSTAIEVALKMAIQYHRHSEPQAPIRIIALEGAYHGDTFGAMAAGERSVFTEPWNDLLFDVVHIPAPNEQQFDAALHALERALDRPAVFIYEPLVQGAAGMKMHPAANLDQLLRLARERGALLIADEVMTGFYRTGQWFASNAMETKPDLLCLSKGLTGGALPMALTVCAQHLYDAFLDDRFERGFLHGHSFTGNPIGCAAALASLDLLEAPETKAQIGQIQGIFEAAVNNLAASSALSNVRHCGCILAADVAEPSNGYLHPLRDQLYHEALNRGVLLRPLGNVLYLLPPYCADEPLLQSTIEEMRALSEKCVEQLSC
jgi:adenosylmethionine-8-amino-7-oxononanoate aminotransferase